MWLDGLALKRFRQRIGWIDIARCISIAVIMYAHIYDTSLISDYVHLFHVAIFFLLSGLVWKKSPDWKTLILNLVRSLVIPYLIVGAFSIAAYQILGSRFTDGKLSIAACFEGLLYANSRTGLMAWNRPLWFIPCLVVVRLIWEAIAGVKKEGIQYLIVLLIWGIGILSLYTDLKQVKLPWQAEVALHALPYFTLGVLLGRRTGIREEKPPRRLLLSGVSLAAFLVTLVVFRLNSRPISFQYNHYGNYALFTLGALAGSVLVCCLAMMIHHARLPEWVGQNTLTILLWHKFPILIFQAAAFGKKCTNSPDSALSIIIGLAVLVVSGAVSLMAGWVIRKALQLVSAKRDTRV